MKDFIISLLPYDDKEAYVQASKIVEYYRGMGYRDLSKWYITVESETNIHISPENKTYEFYYANDKSDGDTPVVLLEDALWSPKKGDRVLVWDDMSSPEERVLYTIDREETTPYICYGTWKGVYIGFKHMKRIRNEEEELLRDVALATYELHKYRKNNKK